MAPTWVMGMVGGVGMRVVGDGAVMGSVVQGSGVEAVSGRLFKEFRSFDHFAISHFDLLPENATTYNVSHPIVC